MLDAMGSSVVQGWEFSPPYKDLHRILKMHKFAHSSFRNSAMKTYPLILFTFAVLLPLAHGAGGAFITAWLDSVGIKYVPPVPPTPMQNSDPTCTDCSKTDQVSPRQKFVANMYLTLLNGSSFAGKAFLGRIWKAPVTLLYS